MLHTPLNQSTPNRPQIENWQSKCRSQQPEAQKLNTEAYNIFTAWKGKKKLFRNFWKPFFQGEKLSKLEVKNLKRFVRRTLFEIFFNFRIDRQLIQNMSDSVFLERLNKIPRKERSQFNRKMGNMKEIVSKLCRECDNFDRLSYHKKLFATYELYTIQQLLKIKQKQEKQEMEKKAEIKNQNDMIQDLQSIENMCASKLDLFSELMSQTETKNKSSSEEEDTGVMFRKDEKYEDEPIFGNFSNINTLTYEQTSIFSKNVHEASLSQLSFSSKVVDLHLSIQVEEER